MSTILKLKSGKKGIIRPLHPWIYKAQLCKEGLSINSARSVTVVDHRDKFIGKGYYNSRSEIAVRILTFKDEEIDKAFFNRRVEDAFKKRERLHSSTNAYRVIFSEADGMPGLIVDLYDHTAVFQVLTLGMELFKELIVGSIKEVIKPKYIYEKSVSPFRKIEGIKDVAQWWGDPGADVVEIFEGNTKFLVDIVNSHKTGFYLDQRRSRMALAGLCKGKKILDLFCYTGAFSVFAAVNGASSVTGVDIKEDWLDMARRNAALNGVTQKAGFLKKDVFAVIEEFRKNGEKFDIVIVDPPSFLKTKVSLVSASKGYKELNKGAVNLLNDDGILATFTCSHNMPNANFSNILKEVFISENKKAAILKRCHQAEDHPFIRAIPETEYLKGYFYKIGPNR